MFKPSILDEKVWEHRILFGYCCIWCDDGNGSYSCKANEYDTVNVAIIEDKKIVEVEHELGGLLLIRTASITCIMKFSPQASSLRYDEWFNSRVQGE